MVKRLTRRVGWIVLVHKADTSLEKLAECFKYIIGYDDSQAATCAFLVHLNGKYAVKSLKYKQKEDAEDIVQSLQEQEIHAELIRG